MAIKAYNPTTPGLRGMTTQDMSEITTKKPIKSLLQSKRSKAGRSGVGGRPGRGTCGLGMGGGSGLHFHWSNVARMLPGRSTKASMALIHKKSTA